MPTNMISELSEELMMVNKTLIASNRWSKQQGANLKAMRGKESIQSCFGTQGLCLQVSTVSWIFVLRIFWESPLVKNSSIFKNIAEFKLI